MEVPLRSWTLTKKIGQILLKKTGGVSPKSNYIRCPKKSGKSSMQLKGAGPKGAKKRRIATSRRVTVSIPGFAHSAKR